MVAKLVNKQNGRQTASVGGECSLSVTCCSCCSISVRRLSAGTVNYTKPPPKAADCSVNTTVQLMLLPHDLGAFEEELYVARVEYGEIQGGQNSGGLNYTIEFCRKDNGKRT